MTMTPATLLATAARYEAHYGCRKGDGGTADQLRAGAEAMVECEQLRAALPYLSPVISWLENGCSIGPAVAELRILRARIEAAEAKLATPKETRND